jgi:hypothetical protein
MSTSARRQPKYVVHDGFRMPMGFPVHGFASGLGYRPLASDVFVASYPKCGTTWMQYVVYLLMNGGSPLPSGRKLEEFFPHLEEVGAEGVGVLPERRMIKTHLPFAMTPYRPDARYVYVARNPFDCAVSFYHHTRGFVHHYDFADGTFDDFFECFIRGEVDFGDYFAHLSSWHAERNAPNILFVTYERMRADTESVIAEVAAFIGEPAASAARDRAMLRAICEESSFRSMSRDQRRWSSARPAGMPEFVRKGIVGDWRGTFTPEQARRLRDEFARRTAGTGPYALWPDVLADVDRFIRGAG